MNRKLHLTLIAAAVLALDQSSKYWLLEIFDIRSRAPVVITENFSLVMAWNRGVSFSMFSHEAAFMPYILMALALIICAVLTRLCLRSEDHWERLGYAFVIGGALGNVIDRTRFGAVADFFYAHIGELGWPAFNIADSVICVGVGVLLLRMVKKPTPP